MKMSIIIPYRPSKGGMSSVPASPVKQMADGEWPWSPHPGCGSTKVVERAIKVIRKNSVWKHDIIIAIDNDMEPNENWLQEFEGVSIFKTKFDPKTLTPELRRYTPFFRLNAAVKEASLALPDDAFVCYTYLADLICGKNWDLYIDEAWQKYGDTKVYAPMWVEPRAPRNKALTWENIWNVWRAELCCHALTVPPFSDHQGYFTEADLDYWAKVATEKNPWKDWIIEEPCGARIYGYFCALCLRNSKLKPVINGVRLGPGWDLELEARLGNKIVVTRSFLYHFHVGIELDNTEVTHR